MTNTSEIQINQIIERENKMQCIDTLEQLELELKYTTDCTHINVIGSPVTALHFESQISLIFEWAMNRVSKFVCVANTHMLIEAYRHPEFSAVLQNADIVTPDGMPLVWMLRLMGARTQNRAAGMDILLSICKLAPLRNISVFFLGSEAKILGQMRKKLEREFPNLRIAGMEPLPFRPLTRAEDEAISQKINDSGAAIVLVALGCPKQEYWMDRHKGKIHAVMIGLGGAFPVYADVQKRAPCWMRDLGSEWLYRLIQEPLRLWHRYSSTIPIFIGLALKQLLILFYQSIFANSKVSNSRELNKSKNYN